MKQNAIDRTIADGLKFFTTRTRGGALGKVPAHVTANAAAILGHLGGLAKSARKTAAVRENGKLGGRPKKVVAE